MHQAFHVSDMLRNIGLRHDMSVSTVISVAAAMASGVSSFDGLYSEARLSSQIERDLVETAARALLAEAPRARLQILIDLLQAKIGAYGGPGGVGSVGSAAAVHLAGLIGDAERVRFMFDASALPCLTYALDALDAGKPRTLLFQSPNQRACLEMEELARVLGVADMIETLPSQFWGGEPDQFEVELAMPPLGLHLAEQDGVPSHVLARLGMEHGRRGRLSAESVAVTNALDASACRVIACVTDGALFRMVGAEPLVRQSLLDSGRLEAVMSVPSGMMWRDTMIRTNLVVLGSRSLGSDRVRFVDLGHETMAVRASRGRSEPRPSADWASLLAGPARGAGLSRDVDVSEIRAQNFVLTPERFLNSGPRERLERFLAQYEVAPLGEVVELIRPVTLSANDSGDYELREAAPADVSESGVLAEPARHIRVDRATFLKAANQQLIGGDVILSIKGNVGVVGLVPDDVPIEGEIWTAGQSLMILRQKRRGGISPVALLRYLSDPTVSEYIKTIAGGTAIQSIAMKDLKEIQVPIPDARTLDEIGAEFRAEHEIFDQIEKLRERLKLERPGAWPGRQMAGAENEP